LPTRDDEFVDPYTYPDSSVLRNRLGLRTQRELTEAEYRLTFGRRVELVRDPIEGSFDLTRLQETHRRLFQDIFEWAGQLRTVEIAKGTSHFLPFSLIHTAADDTFGWLGESGLLLPDIDDQTFVRQGASLLEKVNYIHPFREGNGRTQRAFLDQVAAVSGRKLAWRNIDTHDHLLASIRSFNEADGAAFEPILRRALQPPLDGLDPLDSGLYLATGASAASSVARHEAMRRRFPELAVNDDLPEPPTMFDDSPEL